MHDRLLSILSDNIGELKDNRKYSNALKYDIGEIVFGAFSVFYMQDPSFLSNWTFDKILPLAKSGIS